MEVKGDLKVLVHGMALPGSFSITRAMAVPKEDPDTLLVFRGSYLDNDFAAGQLTSGRYLTRLYLVDFIYICWIPGACSPDPCMLHAPTYRAAESCRTL